MSLSIKLCVLLVVSVTTALCAEPLDSQSLNGTCEPDQNKYFAIGPYKRNWNAARDYCISLGMHLASITSAREQGIIAGFINDIGATGKEFWTSGNDLHEKFDFVWASTDCRFDYTNWATGEPTDGRPQHCVSLNDKTQTWDNLDCYFELYFICERYFN